jgi:murein DD-endopeptidase MepM/ murein hydrolase activator NlpD
LTERSFNQKIRHFSADSQPFAAFEGAKALLYGMSKAKPTAPTSFSFIENERTYTCIREGLRGAQDDPWWWFSVSSDDRHRYAPFRAEPGDTEASVRPRVVAYYEDLLVRRAAPAEPRWRGRGNQGNKAATPAATPVVAPADGE